jgi:ribonuclease T1
MCARPAQLAVPAILLLAAAFCTAPLARTAEPMREVAAAELPSQARETLAKIRAGGPFPYERDGVAFGNREKLLPSKARGYYHEYTVRTPGAKNRGARRIVCGGPKAAPDSCYYTNDHYASFARIRE